LGLRNEIWNLDWGFGIRDWEIGLWIEIGDCGLGMGIGILDWDLKLRIGYYD